MNRILIGISLLIVSLSSSAQQAQRYAIKSGYIKLDLSGSTIGTREIWWDDWGNKSCQLEKSTTTTKMFGIQDAQEKNSCEILVGDKFWAADYITQAGTTGAIPYYQEGQDLVNSMTEDEQEQLANEILSTLGGENVGKETIQGYTCDIISLMGIKSWIHKGISLKLEGSVMGIVSNELAADFKPNTNVPTSKFTPPSDFDYVDQQEQLAAQSGMGGMMEAMSEMEDDDERIIPVNYPFDKFKTVVSGFSYPGYTNRGIVSIGGMHTSALINGMSSIMIMAESLQNNEDGEFDSFESFTHNGHKCYYGNIEEEDGAGLVLEYPAYDMHIIIVAMPSMTKNELIEIAEKLKF